MSNTLSDGTDISDRFIKKPCIFQKNHDFGLKLKIDKSAKYLTIYRSDLILQLESQFRFRKGQKPSDYNWYATHAEEIWKNKDKESKKRDVPLPFVDHFLKHGKVLYPKPDYENDPAIFNELISFIKEWGPRYKRFVEKWIKNPSPNIYPIEYSQVVTNPSAHLSGILEFFNPALSFNEDEIDSLLSSRSEKISLKNSLSPTLYEKILAELS